MPYEKDDPGVERAPSGQPVYRHKAQGDFEPVVGDTDVIETVSAHIERHVGPVAGVFHELISDKVHIDVHMVAPREGRPFHTLVTSGMSERPMTLPAGVGAPPFAELLICLPPAWPLTQEAFSDERNYWPIRWLKTLARLPHDYRTWLGYGHTVPTGDPPRQYAPNTEFCCLLVLPPVAFGEDFPLLETDSGKRIAFYCLIPLYREEMSSELRHGTDSLLDRLVEVGVSEVVRIDRPNSCL